MKKVFTYNLKYLTNKKEDFAFIIWITKQK